MHDCTFASHSRWKWVEGLKHTCVCSIFLSPLSSFQPVLSFSVVMKFTKVLPSFQLSVYVPFGELFLFSAFVLSLCLVSVSSHAANNKPVLISDPFFLLFRCSPSLLLSINRALLFLPSIFSFPRLSPLSSFPSLCLCVTGHAVNSKGKRVGAAHQVDSHGTLSLWLAPA